MQTGVGFGRTDPHKAYTMFNVNDTGLAQHILFNVKFYLIERSIQYQKDESLKRWYRDGHVAVARIYTDIVQQHIEQWNQLKNVKQSA
jgi:hypothetical protein